jgi:superfamily II DNA or RNA helicase
MLQSLSMKEYPDDQFADFGLTVVDEVHHISAEVFVRALQKIITTYTLGLSATMNRKDGLSKVFKMFLGDIIHKEKREKDQVVLIKAVDFRTSDDDFNEMEYDFRGNPKYSTMISKLCNFNIRSEYILYILKNELKLNPEQQILILSHQKNLLVYLEKAVNHRKIGTIGYYIGGMKQNDLKISESKQIILATYSMAAEALDIKTLTSLILATPKTDIEQAVGRILRVKHSNPLIIDIIDQHDIFKRQWLKRLSFYKKNNYKIIHTKDYKSDNWKDITSAEKKELKMTGELPRGKCLITIK